MKQGDLLELQLTVTLKEQVQLVYAKGTHW